MKKLFLTIAILLAGVAVAQAGPRKAELPEAQNGEPVFSSEYAGYDVCRSSLTSNGVFCSSGEIVVAGLYASSNTAFTDFVIIRDTDGAGSSDTNVTEEVFRVYLTSASVVSGTNPGTLGTKWTPPGGPARLKRGLVIKANVSTINMVTVLYHKLVSNRAGEINQ